MKKIALVGTTLALLASAGAALADNDLNAGTMGLTVDTQNANAGFVNGKYFVAKDMAVLAGLGLSNTSGGVGTQWGIMGGIRKYMSTNDFAPFVGGRLTYTSAANGNLTNWNVGAEFGAEYFLNKHFSFEGRVGLGYASQSTTVVVTVPTILGPITTQQTVTTNTFGTTTAALAANFYF